MIDLATIKDYLGVSDTDTDVLIDGMVKSAYQAIEDGTNVDYTAVSDPAAEEYVRLAVWTDFCAMRGIEINSDFVEKRKTQILKALQYARKSEDNAAETDTS